MFLSATALVIVLRLVAAAPRYQTHEDDCRKEEVYVPEHVGSAFSSPDWYPPLLKTALQSIKAHIHGSEGLENGIGKSLIQVDVPSTPQSSIKFSTQSLETMSERIPGWVFFSEKTFQGRIHGNTFWNVKGKLDENFPLDDFLFDPLVFTLNHPTDYDGEFTGQIGRGEINLKWEKSGATITGRSGVGDFTIKGKTYIDWSP